MTAYEFRTGREGRESCHFGGTSAFGGSMLKYQIETDLDILSRKDPEAYKVLSAERDQLLKEGGRRVFSNANDARVQNLVLKLRKATR